MRASRLNVLQQIRRFFKNTEEKAAGFNFLQGDELSNTPLRAEAWLDGFAIGTESLRITLECECVFPAHPSSSENLIIVRYLKLVD